MIRFLAFLVLPVMAAAVIWLGSSCDRADDDNGTLDVADNADNAAGPDDNDDNGDGDGSASPEVEQGLTEQAKRDVRARMEAERGWWRNVRNPVRPQERYAYMKKMLDSMQFFIEYGAWQLVSSPLRSQAQQKRRQPVFLALSAFLQAHTPPPAGTPEGRREAIRMLQEALELDQSFAHGWFLLGRVLLLNQSRQAGSGQMDAGKIREAASYIERALSLYEGFPEAHRYLAMAFAQIGNKDQAVAHARTAIDLDPTDEQNWVIYLQILLGLQAYSELEEVLEMIEQYRPPAGVRLQVFMVLADHFAKTQQFQRAWDAMNGALGAALSEPTIIEREEQWVDLYANLGQLAFLKPSPEPDLGFGFLQEAADHARTHKLPMAKVVVSWARALGVLMQNPPPGVDVQRRLNQLLDLCFESLANEALTDVERGQISQIIAQFLQLADLSKFDRGKMWQLTDWVVEQVLIGNGRLLELSIKMVQALLPITDDDRGRAHIDPDLLGDADDDTLEAIVQLLTDHGLESTAFRINLPAAEMLGHLLTATAGRYDETFVAKARDILGRASTADQNTRKENVFRVIRIHPVEALQAPILDALEAVTDTGDTRACLALFKIAHPALNAIAEDDFRPDWSPDSSTSINEYRALITGWTERIR